VSILNRIADHSVDAIRALVQPPHPAVALGYPSRWSASDSGTPPFAFTQQIYMHVILGIDEEGARLAAAAMPWDVRADTDTARWARLPGSGHGPAIGNCVGNVGP
jgi:hypothetical protein